MMNIRIAFSSAIALLGLIAPALVRSQEQQVPSERIVFSGNETGRCLKCHGMPNFAFRSFENDRDRLRNLTVLADTFKASVHKDLSCQSCHSDIKEYPHQFVGGRTKVSCGADCHALDSKGKPYTHAPTYDDFQMSIHRRGLTDPASGSPTCESCHGAGNPHGVRRAKDSMSKADRMNLCIPCHENRELMLANHVDPDAVSSYRKSFHFKAIRFGQTNTATCQDCHGVHRILPADSAASTISPASIARTCGQEQCHPGVNLNFAMSGANHLNLRIEKSLLLSIEEKLFIVLTLGTMAMLVAGIILDIQKKFGWLDLLLALWATIGDWLRQGQVFAAKILTVARRVLID